jgi:predicted nuclease with TOPRIM domain
MIIYADLDLTNVAQKLYVLTVYALKMNNTNVVNDEINDLKRTISESQDRLNKLVKTKEEEKEDRFRSEVNENAEDLKKIKKELGELESNYDPTQLAKSKEKLDIVVGICYLHDYEVDPYGRFAIGPKDAHEVNTKVKK